MAAACGVRKQISSAEPRLSKALKSARAFTDCWSALRLADRQLGSATLASFRTEALHTSPTSLSAHWFSRNQASLPNSVSLQRTSFAPEHRQSFLSYWMKSPALSLQWHSPFRTRHSYTELQEDPQACSLTGSTSTRRSNRRGAATCKSGSITEILIRRRMNS